MAKYDLSFAPSLMNAAGFLGFAPDPYGPADLSRLGAFVTNPISLEARSPARGPRCLAFPGGMLLHTGHPNPGFKAVLRKFAPRWAESKLPVLVHLLVHGADDLKRMAHALEGLEGVMGLELGLPLEIDASDVAALIHASAGELPVTVRLPLDQAPTLAGAAVQAGASAITLGAPRGALPGKGDGLYYGRLYGPALFPQALAVTRQLSDLGLPVIASGGVYEQEQVETLLAAGALAIQLDTILWKTWNFFSD